MVAMAVVVWANDDKVDNDDCDVNDDDSSVCLHNQITDWKYDNIGTHYGGNDIRTEDLPVFVSSQSSGGVKMKFSHLVNPVSN